MKKKAFIISLMLLSACSGDRPERVNIITGTPENLTVITPPECPDWTKYDGGSNYFNEPTGNFRCANVTNFGLMIDDPNDMVKGKTSRLANGSRAAATVTGYEIGGAAAGAAAGAGAAGGSSGAAGQ